MVVFQFSYPIHIRPSIIPNAKAYAFRSTFPLDRTSFVRLIYLQPSIVSSLLRFSLGVVIILTYDYCYVNIIFSFLTNIFIIFVKLLYYLSVVYTFSEQYILLLLFKLFNYYLLSQPVVSLA